ncbi:hypothetical protein NQ318_018258 [Aromia moschata]|uniref:Reverse transcriptase domain-containing protein n=1 Tax=Aromia moschata TaxID=1265417 RepID=A0AAV8ZF29_9CUCU|nr:hypothetical protein NQ318_018258 [Aromia moschata]
MLSVQMEQWVNLKFLVKLGKTFTEAYAMLKEVYGNECLSCTQVFEWFKGFKEGRLLDTVTLKGTKFESAEAVKAKATEVLDKLTEADFQHCFQQWKSRMARCRDRQGEDIEGEKVATSNKILNEAQSGFRSCRSTTDNFVALQTEIADAYANKQEVVAVIFDIESAFDSTWRPLILNKLAEINLIDNILSFLTNFLTERSSVVTVNGNTSHSFILENGVPQGSVLSTTLFILALNDICSTVIPPVKYALYAEDFFLYCTGKNTSTTCDMLQNQ